MQAKKTKERKQKTKRINQQPSVFTTLPAKKTPHWIKKQALNIEKTKHTVLLFEFNKKETTNESSTIHIHTLAYKPLDVS